MLQILLMKKITQSFLVHTVFGTLDFVSSGNENFCGSKIVSAMKDNSLTFPLEIDLHSKINTF